jgi:beta-lactam-binding protein with PASTA domain
MGFGNFDLDSIEAFVSGHVRLFLVMAAGIIVFVGIVALGIFFIAVRGAEQTMVPDVRGKDLTEALLELQVKELYPRIQVRYSQSSRDRGLILEQEPGAGTIVKAGRRIRLVVSQGAMINSVENYIGRNIDEVRMDLQTLLAGNLTGAGSARPLISLKESFMYEYSDEAPGIILQQNPPPGTEISGPTELEFVVSQGAENIFRTVPGLTGLSINEALELLGGAHFDFEFSQRPPRGGEPGGTVVYQNPAGDSAAAANTRIQITVNAPGDLESGEVFKIFSYTIPENPYPLPVRLEALLPSGERRRLISVDYPGGIFTVPYRLPAGAELILTMVNREIYRETVSPPADPLSPDQL